MNGDQMQFTRPPYDEIRPRRAYFGVAAVIFILGVALFVMFLFQSLLGMTSDLTRVLVPGESEVKLAAPGDYTIFHEYKSIMNGKVYAGNVNISNLTISLRNQDTGEEAALAPTTAGSNYNLGGRSGYGVYNFKIERPGVYVLSAEYEEGRGQGDTVLAISHGFIGNLLKTIFGGIGIFFGTVLISVLIVVVTLIKRKKAREEMEMRCGRDRGGGCTGP